MKTDGPSHPPPVDEGEIMFVDPDHGMVTTRSGLALRFTGDQCHGFVPTAGNVVSIARIEGMQAFGLLLLVQTPPPMFSMPVIDDDEVDRLVREAQREPPVPRSVKTASEQLPSIAWDDVFDEVDRKAPGLSEHALVAALAAIQRPFDRAEIQQILEFDPTVRSLVNPLVQIGDRWPKSWLSLLRWSDGGDFTRGGRYFQDMFSVAQVREYTTLYGIVQSLPGAIPFAMNGGAALYLFDTRRSPVDGEYPVVFCHYSEVTDGWDGVVRLETSFLACCRSETDPEDER